MDARALIRTGATVAVLAAVFGVLGDLYHVTLDRDEQTAVFKAHGILLILALALAIVALVAVLLFHGDRWGGVGRVASFMALVGSVLVAGDIYYETFVTPSLVETSPDFVDDDPTGWHLAGVISSFAVFGAGWLLVGIATVRAGMLTRAGAIVIAVGGLVGFTPLPGSYLLLFIGLGLLGKDLSSKVALEARSARAVSP